MLNYCFVYLLSNDPTLVEQMIGMLKFCFKFDIAEIFIEPIIGFYLVSFNNKQY